MEYLPRRQLLENQDQRRAARSMKVDWVFA
jgi:hypothetical protein